MCLGDQTTNNLLTASPVGLGATRGAIEGANTHVMTPQNFTVGCF